MCIEMCIGLILELAMVPLLLVLRLFVSFPSPAPDKYLLNPQIYSHFSCTAPQYTGFQCLCRTAIIRWRLR
ncbi:hypothetical protein EYZ49_12610 [Salmonella enterica subsp. salamae serovar 13,22:z:-]|nr:hypothetical protein EYZ49_12610 [Salmonella enterica subsp. salamae serovar 13,22:z:-]